MAFAFFWTMKYAAWLGLALSVYVMVWPHALSRSTRSTRRWSMVFAAVSLGLNYVFGSVIELGHVLRN
jgi:polyferredoxin